MTTNSSERPLSFNSGTLILNNIRHEIILNSSLVTVTPTEFKLLAILAGTPGRTYSRDELVTKALGYQFEGYERSIDAHIKNLRQKIETAASRSS